MGPRIWSLPTLSPLLWVCCVTLTLTSCAVRSSSSVPQEGRVPQTVQGAQLERAMVDMRAQRFTTFEAMVAQVAQAQVIAVGEEHYHLPIQALVLHMLNVLTQRRPQRLALAMEFLERDMQPAVDAYLAGTLDESTFQRRIGASEDFMQLYFPLLEHARDNGMPVLAMNIPRRLANQVAKDGLQATLASLSEADKAYVPDPLSEITTEYRTYFLQAVAAAHPPKDAQQATRFLEAAHLKDDTMAATLAQFLERHTDFTVLALAGRFHIDYAKALPRLLRQRQPNVTMQRLTMMAVTPADTIHLHKMAEEALADYVWFAPPPPVKMAHARGK